MRVVDIALASETRRAIAEKFLELAERGIDVQDFDPDSPSRGHRASAAGQRGHYGAVDRRLLHDLGERLSDVLVERHEVEAQRFFTQMRQLPHSAATDPDHLAAVTLVHILPDDFGSVEPEDLRSPNGLRIPDSVRNHDAVREYSARLLLPKLVLAAIAGLTEMSPWVDPDMDLGSAIHTIRPDDDRLAERSGYGGGALACHTDGYWSDQDHVPAWNVMLCAANPFDEPTMFIRISDVFRTLEDGHVDFDRWAAMFAELRRPGQSPRDFVGWVVDEAVKPQFDFVMGSIGGGASRAVRGVPLLEKHRTLPGYLFRYKSTLSTDNDDARAAIDFVNKMITAMSGGPEDEHRHSVNLRPGTMAFALNGCCLLVNPPGGPSVNGVVHLVSGNATIHGRDALRVAGSRVQRTILRCNLVAGPNAADTDPGTPPVHLREGRVATLLRSGYRANHLVR